MVSVRASACYPDQCYHGGGTPPSRRFSSEITAVDNEGLRLGLMLGGLLMAVVPVAVGIAAIIFLFKKYREEQ